MMENWNMEKNADGADTVPTPELSSAAVPQDARETSSPGEETQTGGGMEQKTHSPNGKERKSYSRRYGCLLGCGCAVLILLILLLCIGIFAGIVSNMSSGRNGDFSEESAVFRTDCPHLRFKLVTRESKDDSVRAVIISLNTPGGEVTASDDIHGQILKLKQSKPVVALMNSIAASGGYYVAVACDKIVASRLTLTGSIGVIISSYNYKGLLDKVGIAAEVYKSGEMKDMLNGARIRSPKEIAVIQELVDDSYSEFVRLVSVGRRIPEDRIRNTIIGDGRVLHGGKALKLGLVDKLGRMPAAVAEAEKLAGVPAGSLNVVRYKRNLSFMELLFGSAEARTNPRIQLHMPGMTAGELPPGHLYYLAREFMP